MINSNQTSKILTVTSAVRPSRLNRGSKLVTLSLNGSDDLWQVWRCPANFIEAEDLVNVRHDGFLVSLLGIFTGRLLLRKFPDAEPLPLEIIESEGKYILVYSNPHKIPRLPTGLN